MFHTDGEYARIDTANAPGYFTCKNGTVPPAVRTTAPVTTTAAASVTTKHAVTTTASAPSLLRGDVNGDNIVSVDDAQLTLKAYTERIAGNDMKLTDEQIKAADIDGNGEISVEDAQWLLKYYTENYVAGKDITWDDILGKKTQALPQLMKKGISSLKLR